MIKRHEIVIVGGGMVGASLACTLAGSPISVAVIDLHPYSENRNAQQDDPRFSALSAVSQHFFQALGMWPQLQDHACPIRSIHISQAASFGVAQLHHHHVGEAALGYVLANQHIQAALWQRLAEADNITVYAPGKLATFQIKHDAVYINAQVHKASLQLRAKLLVAADGMHSAVRQAWHLPTHQFDYRQTALIGSVRVQNSWPGWAFERFTADGPLALLPIAEATYAFIWCMPTPQAQRCLACTEVEFLHRLQQSFGRRMGSFQHLKNQAQYPLRYTAAAHFVKPRSVLLGNAVHSLHPVAGQGLNLSLRDVKRLAQVLLKCNTQQQDPGAMSILRQYAQHCRQDQLRTEFATHLLVRGFDYRTMGLRTLRSGAILAFDRFDGVKSWFARQAMGGYPWPAQIF